MSIIWSLVATGAAQVGEPHGREPIITNGLVAIAVGDPAFPVTTISGLLLAAARIALGVFFCHLSDRADFGDRPPSNDEYWVGYRFSADLGAFVGPVLLAGVMDLANAQLAISVAVAILLTASLVARLGVPRRVDMTPVPQP